MFTEITEKDFNTTTKNYTSEAKTIIAALLKLKEEQNLGGKTGYVKISELKSLNPNISRDGVSKSSILKINKEMKGVLQMKAKPDTIVSVIKNEKGETMDIAGSVYVRFI